MVIGGYEFPFPDSLFLIPVKFFYFFNFFKYAFSENYFPLQDIANRGQCYTILQDDRDQVHPEGKPALVWGKVILDYYGAIIDEENQRIGFVVQYQNRNRPF